MSFFANTLKKQVINTESFAKHLFFEQYTQAQKDYQIESNQEVRNAFRTFFYHFMSLKSRNDFTKQLPNDQNLLDFLLESFKIYIVSNGSQWKKHLKDNPLREEFKNQWPKVYDFLIALSDCKTEEKQSLRSYDNNNEQNDEYVGKKVLFIIQSLAKGLYAFGNEIGTIKHPIIRNNLNNIINFYKRMDELVLYLNRWFSRIQNKQLQSTNIIHSDNLKSIDEFICRHLTHKTNQMGLPIKSQKEQESLQNRISFQEIEINSLKNQLFQLQKFQQSIQTLLQSKTKSCNELSQKIVQLQNELNHKDKLVEQYLRQIKILTQQSAQLTKLVKEKDNNILRIQKELFDKNKQFVENQQIYKNLQSKLEIMSQNYKLQQSIYTEKISALHKQLQNQKAQINQAKQSSNQAHKLSLQLESLKKTLNNDHRSLFNHAIFFQHYYQQKEYLVNQIKNRVKRPIGGTKLLYKFDKTNLKIPFHDYIDHHPYLVVIVEFEDGRLIAAYSEGQLSKKMTTNTDAILISLTEKQTFYLKPKVRGLIYDEYYLIFGESDLRLKPNVQQIFSNFGLINSSFEPRGHTVRTILGQRDPPRITNTMKAMEAYSLHFDQY